MIRYIIQIIVFQLVFLLVYELFLKKETFFTANRWYLLLTPVLSLVLPFASFTALSEVVPASALMAFNNTIKLPEVFIGINRPQVEQLPAVHIKAEEATTINWWLVVYIFGCVLSLLLFLKRWRVIGKLFQFKAEVKKNFRIVEIPNSRMAFTFLKTIFLGSDISAEEREQILVHELIHVSQKHSLDLLFFEVLKVVFWFNPFVYIFQHRIAALHEFIADEAVVKRTSKKYYFNQLLNSAFDTQNLSFTNQFFNQSLIKKRIVMLQKQKSKTIAKFKFLLVVPLLAMMLIYVSCSDEEATITKESPAESFNQIIASIETRDDLSSKEKEALINALNEVEAKMKNGQNIEDILTENEIQNLKGQPANSDMDIPFAVIEQVPVFAGCETLETNEERKACTSEKIMKHVQKEFDMSIGEELLKKDSIFRVIVQFKIDETGSIRAIRARAPIPELEEEAKRVVNSIPQMTPGKQRGKAVSVMYSLPITFTNG